MALIQYWQNNIKIQITILLSKGLPLKILQKNHPQYLSNATYRQTNYEHIQNIVKSGKGKMKLT